MTLNTVKKWLRKQILMGDPQGLHAQEVKQRLLFCGHRSSRLELQMQLLEAANDEARFKFEVPVASRPMLVLRQVDVGSVFEEAFEDDADLHSGERRPGANMGAPAERKVLLDLLATKDAFLGRIPAPRIEPDR